MEPAPEINLRSGSPVSIVVWCLFLLVVVSLGFMQPYIFVSMQRLSLGDFIFPVLVIFWLAALIFRKERLMWHSSYWLLGAYFASMIVSSIFSVYPPTSYIKLLGEAYLLGLAVITYSLIDRERRFKQAVYAWFAATIAVIAVTVVTIALFYAQPDHWLIAYTTYHAGAVPVLGFPRISSTFVSASMFCIFLNVSVVLAFVARQNGWIGRNFFCLLLVSTILSAFSTMSIGIGGVLAAVGLCVWLTSKTSRPTLAKISLAAAIAVASVFYGSSFFALQPHDTAPYTISVPFSERVLYPSPRLMVWTETVKTFLRDPIAGKGLDQPVCAVSFQNTDGSYSTLTDAHNIYLSVAAENGVIGLLAMLALCLYLSWIGYRSTDITTRLLGVGFVTAFIYQGLTGAYEDARHLWVLMGMLLAVSKLRSSS